MQLVQILQSDKSMNERDLQTDAVDALVRDIFLAFVRVHVLHHATEGPIYGVEMIEELAGHGYQIGPGTMYPTLHALREKDCLAEERRVVGGKVRKYYHFTLWPLLVPPQARWSVHLPDVPDLASPGRQAPP